MSDLRKKRTRLAIFNSFQNQMEQKDFTDILVTDIVKDAMIHRNTFYQHYDDKYDLLHDFLATALTESEVTIDEFKEKPFSSIHKIFKPRLEKVWQKQISNNEFFSLFPKIFIQSFVEKNENDYSILWDMGRLVAVLAWTITSGSDLSAENNPKELDNIYKRGIFPKV
ncbi:hypothetical protein GSH19_05515 [Lactobacillus sp. S2-2]|uniref:hypothetical protein n=1 Tax=Lactobacillus sp. S2-2 TaxID=2692917 RepID=UPI001F488122|nr:hypothetical protein [Lactobacillus sp. S2-2]MCF6515609.1 hypothetical protein [Lactobacillus sp. S2-2]